MAKQILQDLCRTKLGWDEEIPPEYASRWENWLLDLPKLSLFAVNRCLKTADFGQVKSSQLHHFSDASEVVYGSVSSLRLVNEEGKIQCLFLFGKSCLAPLKTVSIPRLKLSAATISIRQDKMLKRETDIPLSVQSIFWMDSMSVLLYVKNESKHFHAFVANRISMIRDGSTPHQWCHVEGIANPGGHASRGMSAEALLNCERWLMGPKFLWKTKEEWPKAPMSLGDVPVGDPEVKADEKVCMTSAFESACPLVEYFQRTSSWQGLKKSVAWLLRYRDNLRSLSNCRK